MSTDSALVGSVVCALMEVQKKHLPILLEAVNALNKEHPEHILFAKRLQETLPVKSLLKLLKAQFQSWVHGVVVPNPTKSEIEEFTFLSRDKLWEADPAVIRLLGTHVQAPTDHGTKIKLDLYKQMTDVFKHYYTNLGHAPVDDGRVYSFDDAETCKYVLAAIMIAENKGKEVLPRDVGHHLFWIVSPGEDYCIARQHEILVRFEGVWKIHLTISYG